MNELIKEQLSKVKMIKIPPYDDSTTHIYLHKLSPDNGCIVYVDKYYLLEFEDYIINPPDGFTLHVNWNNGIKPFSKYMKCQVTADLGKMIKITGIGYDMENQKDIDKIWEGWIPKESITVIQEL